MVVRFVFYLSILLFCFSCANVGVISGGPRDVFAPKLISSSVANGEKNVSVSEIEFEFDEFFNLNDAKNNIILQPADVEISTTQNKKKLTLNFEGKLKENTTYQLVFFNAIQDLHEKNDSIFTHVFSTGNIIDSLNLSVNIESVTDLKPSVKMLVGLYHIEDSFLYKKPVYYSLSDNDGIAKFSFLKEGNYKLFGFIDENKDLKYQVNEITFLPQDIIIQQKNDTIINKSFKAKDKNKFSDVAFFYPNGLKFSKNFFLDSLSKIKVNNESLKHENLYEFTEDSLFYILQDTSSLVILTSGLIKDSAQIRTNLAKKTFNYFSNEKLPNIPNGSLDFIFPEEILNVDSGKFTLYKDSLEVKFLYAIEKNSLKINKEKLEKGNYFLKIPPNVLNFENLIQKDSIIKKFEIKSLSDFGSIIIDEKVIVDTIVVEMYKENKWYKKIAFSELQISNKVDFIEPGNYTFKLLIDKNKNGRWDAGDVFNNLPAEEYQIFSKPIKIRANWESEINFESTE